MVIGVVGQRSTEQKLPELSKRVYEEQSRKVITRGFTVFSWYVRITMGMVILALSPLVMAYLVASFLLDVAKLRSSRVPYSRAVGSQDEKVDRSPVRKLSGRTATQFFVCGHVFVSNIVFFMLIAAAVLKITSPAMATASIFRTAALFSLIPASLAGVLSAAHFCFSRFLRESSLSLLNHCCKQSCHAFEKVQGEAGDSILGLMRRDKLDMNYVSMSSLSVLDKQLLYGVPTMLTAICCYKYDLHMGQERQVRDLRAQDITLPGRGYANVHIGRLF